MELYGSNCGIAGVSVDEDKVSGSLRYKKMYHLVDLTETGRTSVPRTTFVYML